MEVSLDGKFLVIRIPFDENGTDSATGKSKVHASTRGNVLTPLKVKGGKNLTVGVNAYSR